MTTLEREFLRTTNSMMGSIQYAEAMIDVLMISASRDLVVTLPQIISVEIPRDRPEGYEHKRCQPALVLDYRPGIFDLLDEDPAYYLPLLEELLRISIRLSLIDMILIVDSRQTYWLAASGFGFALING